MKGLEVRTASLVAQLQSAEVTEPTERAFDDVACLAESAAVGPCFSERGQERFDSQPLHNLRQIGRTVAGIALQGFGFGAWSASRSSDRLHVDDQWQRNLIVARIGWRRFHRQRNALGIGQHMPLTTSFCTVRRVRPSVRPPKTARTLALSITARSRFIA